MQLYIDKIDRSKTINTQYGSKVQVGVKSRGKWYSCLSAAWNNSWKEGDTIDVETQDRHVNGKVYVNITGLATGAIVKSSSNNSAQPNQAVDILNKINSNLEKIVAHIQGNAVDNVKAKLGAIQSDDDIPF